MKLENYIEVSKSLVYITLACSLVSLLLSKTKFGASIRYLCGVITLVFVVGLLSPLILSVGDLINTDLSVIENEDYNATSDEAVINQSAAYICKYVKTLIAQKYTISEDDISVTLTLDKSEAESIAVKNVTLKFNNTDEGLYPEISQYISNYLGCECIVISK